jgi:tape measure domain-containing protein
MAQDDVTLNIGANTDAAEKAFKNLEKQVLETGKDIQKVAKKSAGAWSTFKGVLGAQAVVGGLKAVSRAAVSMGKSFIDAAAGLETISTELTTVTGSAEEAEKLLKELTDFAATTPFQLEGIARASKQLIAFGFETETVRDRLQQIGDVAAGSGAQLSDVSLIYGQVAAAGKLTGERLLQFQERAIPIGPAIAKTMGIAEEAVKDTVSKGRVDLATFEKAFKSLSEEGGIFYESMIDKSETFAGVTSTLNDNISLLAAEIGKELLPAMKELAKEFIKFIQTNKKDIVQAFKDIAGSVGTLVGWMDKLRKGLGFDKEFNRLKANGDKIDELRTKIRNLQDHVKGGIGFFESESEFERKKNAILNFQDELALRLKLNAKLVKEGAAGTTGENFVKRLEESKKVITDINKEVSKPGGIQTESFWDGMVSSFDAAQKEMAKNAAANWKTALLKIGKSLGGALTTGTTSTRSGLDDIKKIEKKMAIAKAHNELAEYDKLVDEKIEAEKRLAKVQEEEAGKFFSSTAGAVADMFLPGAGAFVETLLSLAQDPQAFASFIDGFVSALPVIIDFLVEATPTIIEALANNTGPIIAALARGMVLVSAVLVQMVADGIFRALEPLINVFKDLAGILANAAGTFLNMMADSARTFLSELLSGVGNFADKVAQAVKEALGLDSKGGIGSRIVGGIGEGAKGVGDFLSEGVGKVFGFADGVASIPAGFPNDTFGPVGLTSGEEVVSVDDKASIKRELSLLAQTVAASQGGEQTINVQLTLDGNVLAEQILQLDRDNQRLTA